MNVALISPGFSRDANDWAIPTIQTLAERLAQSHTIHVFSLRYPRRGRYHFLGITHHATGGGTRGGFASVPILWQTISAIQRQYRQTPFDVLHAFWGDEAGLAAVLAGRLLRRPSLVGLPGGELIYLADINYGTQGSPWRRLIVRLALRNADAILVGSTYQAQLAQAHGVSPHRIHWLPWGVDTNRFQPGTVPGWNTPTLIQAASLSPVKDQALLMQILRRVKGSIPAIRLLIAGEGPLEPSLERLAATLDVADNITWLGATPHSAMPSIYRQAHLYVQTSRHEGQGMSVLEAMACGLPAVGTPVGVLPEVSPVPPSWQAGELADAIIALLQDEKRYVEHRTDARRCVEEQFSLAVSAERFLSCYEAMLPEDLSSTIKA